jgi:CO/xanthine dehydrogenase FAD-binding subunit
MKPGELLVEMRIAAPKAHSSDAYQRLIPRNEMDIAVVGVGAAITLDGNRCVAAKIALGAVGPTQIVARKAGESLIGKMLDAAAIENAGRLASEVCTPIDDMRGTAEYRRHITGVLTQRTLQTAAERARRN